MEQFYLEKVKADRKEEIIEYIRELYTYKSRINGVGGIQNFVTEDTERFEEWFSKIKNEEGEELSKTSYMFIRKEDDRLIGMVNIRMQQDLKDYPYGHIGYSIRPTERGKGYGKLQFYAALKELEENGIFDCQMSCEVSNDKSRNVIKNLGGVYEKTIGIEEYYYVDVKKSLKQNKEKYEEEICR